MEDTFEGKSWWDKSWKEKDLGGKFVTALAWATPGGMIPMAANEIRKFTGHETQKTKIARNAAEAQRMIEESEKSPYNEAKVSQENIDYYNKILNEYSKAQREKAYGFSPEEIAAARQGYAETTNLARQNALAAGGGTMGKYINANLNAGQGQFANQLASQDAALRAQRQQQIDQRRMDILGYLGGSAKTSQDVATQNFQKQLMAEQALGQAKSQWEMADLQRKQQNKELATQVSIEAIKLGAELAKNKG